jgi:hypothetical protein
MKLLLAFLLFLMPFSVSAFSGSIVFTPVGSASVPALVGGSPYAREDFSWSGAPSGTADITFHSDDFNFGFLDGNVYAGDFDVTLDDGRVLHLSYLYPYSLPSGSGHDYANRAPGSSSGTLVASDASGNVLASVPLTVVVPSPPVSPVPSASAFGSVVPSTGDYLHQLISQYGVLAILVALTISGLLFVWMRTKKVFH